MLIRFWGTRGSIAAPGSHTIRYGGNTSCVELRSGNSQLIFDCGTGARGLGGYLAAQGQPIRPHLLLTHFHWDHIQGFPFFVPIFLPNSELRVYGTAGLERGLEEAMSGQMQYTYFPVRLADLLSRIEYHEVGEATFHADEVTVRTQFLNHTCPTLGYRAEAGGTSVAYVTDHEPFWPHNPDLPLADALVHPGDQRHVEFVRGVDLLIHDSQYTAEEYPAKRGWGHSTVEYVVDVAAAAGVRRLVLFHHDPARSDEQVDRLLAAAQERARHRGADLQVIAAAEGAELRLEEASPRRRPVQAVPSRPAAPPGRIAVLGAPDRRRALREALAEDGYRLSEADLKGRALDSAASEPDLLLVALSPNEDAVRRLKTVRRVAGDRPVMAVLEGVVDEALLRRLAVLTSDVVVVPYSPPNLRARVRAVLARRTFVGPPQAIERGAVLLDNMQLVDRLSGQELDELLRTAVPCSFRPGEILFHQGDAPTGVYYLRSGHLRITVTGQNGREITLGFAGPGDTVGEIAALDGAPRSATASALEPVEASYVARELFQKALERAPATSVRLLKMMARRLRATDERLALAPVVEESEARENGQPGLEAPRLADRLNQPPGQLADLLRELDGAEEALSSQARHVAEASVRVREWRQAVHVLRRVTQAFAQARTREARYRQTVNVLGSLVPSEAVALYLTNTEGLVRVAALGRGTPNGWRMDALPAHVASALASEEPQVAAWEGPTATGGGERWGIIAPLRVADSAAGVLWLRRAAPPTQENLAVVEIVATTAALVVQRQAPQSAAQFPARMADLEAALQVELERAGRLDYPVGILIGRITPDGHPRAARGARLGQLAGAIRGTVRRTDMVASSATGDLGVILPGMKSEGLERIEARVQDVVRETLQAKRRTRPDRAIRFAALVARPREQDARELLDRARQALAQESSVSA